MKKSVDKETLMEDLNDKRVVGIEMNQDMWRLSRKETAEHLLDKYNVTPKSEIEPDNEKPYLFYEGEKYYFGEEYEFSENKCSWFIRKLKCFDQDDVTPFYSSGDSYTYIRKTDHTTKYKKLFIELKEQAEKDGVNLKEIL